MASSVILNEIYPKTSDPGASWIELYNTGSQSVSLNRWHITGSANDQSYILNASAIIAPHGFLTLSGSQTAIRLGIHGDTVALFDEANTLVDQIGYMGTLGYNTSFARSPDAGTWVICAPAPQYLATPNAANNCPPPPSPTPTPQPTPTPTPTVGTTPTPTPTVPPTLRPEPTPGHTTGPELLGVFTSMPSPTPVEEDVLRLSVPRATTAYVLLIIAAVALSLMLTLWLARKNRKTTRRKPDGFSEG